MDATNQEHKQKLVDTFINAIYLYDDKIVFTFNYKDSTKTINLDDVKSSFGSDLSVEGAPKKRGPAVPRRGFSFLDEMADENSTAAFFLFFAHCKSIYILQG